MSSVALTNKRGEGIRLAIVTPSFNRGEGLRRLHQSLRRQRSALEWCHIVVDDASHEPITSGSICGDSSRLIVVRNERNSGALVSRNRALDAGESWGASHFAFVDDDDFVEPWFFDYLIEVVGVRAEIGWYVSRCRFLGHQPASAEVWPDSDGVFDWFDDMQIKRRFCPDVMHVISAERIGSARFSTLGRRQREWLFLAKIAQRGGFYASNARTKVATYEAGGLTLGSRSPDEELCAVWNYVQKQLVLVWNRPSSVIAWRGLLRQMLAAPVRVLQFFVRKLSMVANGR